MHLIPDPGIRCTPIGCWVMQRHSIPKYDFFHPAILDFVACSGSSAESWVVEYRRSGASDVEERSTRALKDLRKGSFEKGAQRLDEIERQISALADAPVDPAIVSVAQRWFHSVQAFRMYLCKHYEVAEQHLVRAEDAIRSAIGRCDFLQPFAHHCIDFTFQKARLARQTQTWLEMRSHLATARSMNLGQEPLCVLPDGREISIVHLRQFYHSLPLSHESLHSLRSLLDSELCLFMTERSIRRFYARLGPTVVY